MASPLLAEAVALHRAGRLEQARPLYRRHLRAAPKDFQARYLLAMLDCQTGRSAEAVGTLRRLAAEEPRRLDVRYTLGRALNEIGAHEEALDAFRAVIAGEPANHEAFLEAVRAAVALEDWPGAVDLAERGLAVHPALPALHQGRGVALGRLDRRGDAVVALLRARTLDPRDADTLYALGRALRHLNRLEEADAALGAALALAPGMLRARLLRSRLVPVIYAEESEIDLWRDRVAAGLETLAAEPPPRSPAAAAATFEAVSETTNFYLSYQGRDDRGLATLWGDYVHRTVAARFPDLVRTPPSAPPAPARRRETKGVTVRPARRRIGFRSAHLVDHTVLHLFRAWMTDLDRDRFELFIYGPASGDAETERLAGAVEHFRSLPADVERAARAVRGDRLDALIHLDIGMEPAGMCLGAMRLAPVQAVAWGHPVTTGLPTMDWFLSSAAMEPPDGDAHYRERLLRLPGLGIGFTPPPVPDRPADRRALGVAEGDALFFVGQSLFKLLPQHDHVWAEIAERVPTARFLFLAGGAPEVAEGFSRRLERAFAARGLRAEDHVRWSPRVDRAGYLALNAACDLFLDGVGWSGGRTTLEAVACGLLPLTTPGPFMRGRHTAGILTELGLPEAVAADKVALVELAARAATDTAWREDLRARMIAGRDGLFAARDWKPALEGWLADPG